MSAASSIPNKLLIQVEEALKMFAQSPRQTNQLLLSPWQVFHLGACLENLKEDVNLDTYLAALPDRYRTNLLEHILKTSVEHWSSNDSIAILQSVGGLLEHSEIVRNDWFTNHPILLGQLVAASSQELNSAKLLELYMRHETNFEHLLTNVQTMQENEVVWNNVLERLQPHTNEIVRRFPDHTEYLGSLLNHQSRQEEEAAAELRTAVQAVRIGDSKPAAKPTAVAPKDELQRRIDQVQAILPDLGPGFIEACLSFYKGNVEETVSKILSDELPTNLQRLDRSLPRHFDPTSTLAQQEAEAKQITKKNLQDQAKKEERTYEKLAKFNIYGDEHDDYDDQYDDIDGVGKLDHGLYDDYDSVMEYNRFVKDAEKEDSFWEENKNTNRVAAPGKKHFGPDKVRGGRIPGRGGRRGNGPGRGNAGRGEGEASANANKKPNLKAKARKMDKRREQQKKAQVTRSS